MGPVALSGEPLLAVAAEPVPGAFPGERPAAAARQLLGPHSVVVAVAAEREPAAFAEGRDPAEVPEETMRAPHPAPMAEAVPASHSETAEPPFFSYGPPQAAQAEKS